jgi:hypothetical protein
VVDRGAVRFDYPSGWVVESAEGAVMLHDMPPSVESCDLGGLDLPAARRSGRRFVDR